MISTLEDKLATNYVPTTEEVASIRHDLADSEDHLCRLSIQVDELQSRCDQLVDEQQLLSISLAKYKGMLSPFRRLIPDILQEIFYHCLPTSHNAVISNREAPLLLGEVCRHWRDVSRSTPRLWSSIHITLPALTPYDPAHPNSNSTLLSAASSWLSRSGVLPLRISFSSNIYSRLSNIPTNAHVQPFLDLFSTFSPRWKAISFRLENYDWDEFFDRFDAKSAPLLECIHLDGTHIRPTSPGMAPNLLTPAKNYNIFTAPQLLSISIPAFASHILEMPVNWSQLTELDLSNGALALRVVQKALSRSPNLRICAVFILAEWNDFGAGDDPYSPSRIVLSELGTLSIRDDLVAQRVIGAFFESLIAPKLRHLSFRRGMSWGGHGSSEERTMIRSLNAFCHSLVHPLQELELDANSTSSESVMQVLESLPDLKRLSLHSQGQPEIHGDMPYPPWMSPNAFYLTDELLRRFIPKLITVRHHGSNPAGRDTIQSTDNWDTDSDSESEASALDVPLVGLFNSPSTDSGSETRNIVNRLCPNLEAFHCSGAMFSEESLLEFIRARTLKHRELGVVRLRRVGVSFVSGRKPDSSFAEQILKLAEQTETTIIINYPEPLLPFPAPYEPPFSVYQGIDHSDYNMISFFPTRFGPW
ncbi:hypothetical protein NP233_g11028 [Leucocoprinus birnbaumii]|uniref:F-box domain-containing protein n=1 Tax=Leucocoprinus birnbaumii TaxID=56174 RepID=A0AAD5VHT4_9AGAR|nr:hypothetical protein NP233_g11028 [Leucocoprinus birnbaumii]